MHVSINDWDLGPLEPGAATVGEVVDALAVHIDPREILTVVAVDGTEYSAGDPDRYASQPAARVTRLALATQEPAAFAAAMREEVAAALSVVADKLRMAVARFRQQDDRAANSLLATAMEELHLVLVLDQRLLNIDSGRPAVASEEVAALAPALLEAEENRRWGDLSDLLEARLLPLLDDAVRVEKGRRFGNGTGKRGEVS